MAVTRSSGVSVPAVQRSAGAVLDGPLAAEFGVPDGQLPVEVPKTGKSHQVDAVGRGGRTHGQETVR